MSGGHWDYFEFNISEFGETLEKEDDFVLKALGVHLQQLAKYLQDADRWLSYDSSEWYTRRECAEYIQMRLPEATKIELNKIKERMLHLASAIENMV